MSNSSDFSWFNAFSWIYELNSVLIAIIVMVILSLSRVSVVFSLLFSAIIGGLIAKMPISKVVEVLTEGLGGGATLALSYAILGAFAVALSRSGIADILAYYAIKQLTGKSVSAKSVSYVNFMLIALLLTAAFLSQNIIPVHIAFIPILIPPLLGLMNTLKLDRRLVACTLTFGLVATYMFVPIGFGEIFMYELLLKNLQEASKNYQMTMDREMVVTAMAIPFLGMFVGLLIAYFFSYKKPREYAINARATDTKQANYALPKLKMTQVILILVALVGTVSMQLKYDSLMLGGLFGFAVLSLSGVFKWNEQDNVFMEGMRMMAQVGFIMISAAGFAAVMKATGDVESMVTTSMEVIGDRKGLAALVMLLVGLFITMGIGSSFSTIPIITVIFVPIAAQLGFSPTAIVAIVGTAAVLGDAGSPASDSTLGPTAGLNTDGQHNHIWDSVVPTFIHYNIPLIIFGWIAAMIL
ncbi:Na+/H+ antiporter family protein [Thorsellia kenyensis]|uniref:Na+/H+ antiporter family protein n=1 Tax=Thorsellia kenyensis TaxID=1549888 RepID=A0ABV6C8P5_9GAMM